MDDFLAALALVLVIEGLLYAAFPKQMKQAIDQMMQLPAFHFRIGALIVAGVGMIALWLVRG